MERKELFTRVGTPALRVSSGNKITMRDTRISSTDDPIDSGLYISVAPIFKAKNISIASPLVSHDAVSTIIEEDVFILDMYQHRGLPYFHLIYDLLGEYELILQQMPDTKLLIMFSSNDPGLGDGLLEHSIMKDIISAYKIEDRFLIDVNTIESVVLDSVVFCNTEYTTILKKLYFLQKIRITNDALAEFAKDVSSLIKKRFCSVDNTADKKMFLSRKRSNVQARIKRSALIKKHIDGVSDDDLTPIERGYTNNSPVALLEQEISRYISEEDELLVENFFLKKGYEIVELDGKSIFEQADILNSASHVAGFAGTAMVNTIFCSRGTNVLIINNCDVYTFPHAGISELFGNTVVQLPKTNPILKRVFSGDEIIEEISKNMSI